MADGTNPPPPTTCDAKSTSWVPFQNRKPEIPLVRRTGENTEKNQTPLGTSDEPNSQDAKRSCGRFCADCPVPFDLARSAKDEGRSALRNARWEVFSEDEQSSDSEGTTSQGFSEDEMDMQPASSNKLLRHCGSLPAFFWPSSWGPTESRSEEVTLDEEFQIPSAVKDASIEDSRLSSGIFQHFVQFLAEQVQWMWCGDSCKYDRFTCGRDDNGLPSPVKGIYCHKSELQSPVLPFLQLQSESTSENSGCETESVDKPVRSNNEEREDFLQEIVKIIVAFHARQTDLTTLREHLRITKEVQTEWKSRSTRINEATNPNISLEEIHDSINKLQERLPFFQITNHVDAVIIELQSRPTENNKDGDENKVVQLEKLVSALLSEGIRELHQWLGATSNEIGALRTNYKAVQQRLRRHFVGVMSAQLDSKEAEDVKLDVDHLTDIFNTRRELLLTQLMPLVSVDPSRSPSDLSWSEVEKACQPQSHCKLQQAFVMEVAKIPKPTDNI